MTKLCYNRLIFQHWGHLVSSAVKKRNQKWLDQYVRRQRRHGWYRQQRQVTSLCETIPMSTKPWTGHICHIWACTHRKYHLYWEQLFNAKSDGSLVAPIWNFSVDRTCVRPTSLDGSIAFSSHTFRELFLCLSTLARHIWTEMHPEWHATKNNLRDIPLVPATSPTDTFLGPSAGATGAGATWKWCRVENGDTSTLDAPLFPLQFLLYTTYQQTSPMPLQQLQSTKELCSIPFLRLCRVVAFWTQVVYILSRPTESTTQTLSL